MGIDYNPSIVTNGLASLLDARNTKSYPGSGTAWSDISGIGNNATLSGSPTYNPAISGGAFILDGVNDEASIDGTAFTYTDNNDFSIELMINSGTNDVYKGIIAKRTNSNYTGWAIYRSPGGGINIQIANGHLGPYYTSGVTVINNTDIYISVIYKKGSYVSFYINSMLQSNLVIPDLGSIANSTNLLIGREVGISNFNGNLYSIKIYNRALAPTEIIQNFNAIRGRFGI